LKKIIVVLGNRPQFIKYAALHFTLLNQFDLIIVNTGQHYDKNLSEIFFSEFDLPKPKYNLNIKEKSSAMQVANMMMFLIDIISKEKPDLMIVFGDTNSTLAGALSANKCNIKIAHIEAGVRSYNKEMEEECNRVVVDYLSSIAFCPNQLSKANFNNINPKAQSFVSGDLLLELLDKKSKEICKLKNTQNSEFYFCTLHRPYNVDNIQVLTSILEQLNALDLKVIFATHPRVLKQIKKIKSGYTNIEFLKPQNYTNTIKLQMFSKAVITDSGGIQREACFLNKKCIILRTETEWPELLGKNCKLVSNYNKNLQDELNSLQDNIFKSRSKKSASIITKKLIKYLK
jgi:UDP-GlcNAc3NAcA epimerase